MCIRDRFNGFQILCALRDGPFGVTGLNERLELALAKAGLIQRDGDWYAGRPVMVVRNDHGAVSYTHLDVYKRQLLSRRRG